MALPVTKKMGYRLRINGMVHGAVRIGGSLYPLCPVGPYAGLGYLPESHVDTAPTCLACIAQGDSVDPVF